VGDASSLDRRADANQSVVNYCDDHPARREQVFDIAVIEMLLIVRVQQRHDRVNVGQRRRANFHLFILAARLFGVWAQRGDTFALMDPAPLYRDATCSIEERVADLVERMTLPEKLAQLVGLWVSLDAATETMVAFGGALGIGGFEGSIQEHIGHGLGQLTRPFGSAPIEPSDGARILAEFQRNLVDSTRLGIPALVHEECLTGFTAWQATTYPCPLAYGATWDPELIERVGRAIGAQLRSVGVHQGLAPVLDVVRDARWGRVEECLGEDPYLVAVMGTAYVRGLQGSGVIATAKHFAGYSSSEGGRNFAPVHAGPREMFDVFLIPFEMAVKHGGLASVMNAYTEIDGVPAAADAGLLTDLLRRRWGFGGTVVSDSVTFLQTLHHIAGDRGAAAVAAITAGVDVELPNPSAYAEPLEREVEEGRCPEGLVDRAVRRVLRQKVAIGLLEARFDEPTAAPIDLDPPEHRALAREVAERSITLLRNEGERLPLDAASVGSIAVIGPNADDPRALMGNYSFANHTGVRFPDTPLGVEVTTVVDAIRHVAGSRVDVDYARGCDVVGDDITGIDAAVALAAGSDLAIVVVGDRAGPFGRGTVGEGTDTESLALPGVQQQLLEAVVATGTATVLVLVNGRPFDLTWAATHVSAIAEAWFPGEAGGEAVADVLFGNVNPSGRLTVSFPRSAAMAPWFYNHRTLGGATIASSTRPESVFAFGHGLAYTTFAHTDLGLSHTVLPTDGHLSVSCRVSNTGSRPGTEVVQLYTRDLVGSVTRPVLELVGFARVDLGPGQSRQVRFEVHTDRLSFTGRTYERVVEPGIVEIMVGRSSADIVLRAPLELVGLTRVVGDDRVMTTPVTIS
jgi:beta-xylosidase